MAGKLSVMQIIIIQFVAWLGWASCIALAQQFSDTLTGSANISDLGIACLINTAVFVTSFLRGRLYLEMGARDVMASITVPAELKEISDLGTLSITDDNENVSVVMLSGDLQNSSMRLFMKYMFTRDVYSTLLKYVSLEIAIKDHPPIILGKLNPELNCTLLPMNRIHECNCIVFQTEGQIREKLLTQIPLKALNGSHCLLPCQECRKNRCHNCNEDPLYLEDSTESRWNYDGESVESSAVCEALDEKFREDNEEEHICICVPLSRTPREDDWTKTLVKSLKSKDAENIGARVSASILLESYLSMNGESNHAAKYYNPSTFITPRLLEIIINIVLTCWLKLDGFSSAIVARNAVRNHIVDSTGNGFAANAFLTAVLVNYVRNNSVHTVCQKLRFRGGTFLNLKTQKLRFSGDMFLNLKTLSFLVGFVNVICSLGWALSIALAGDHAAPPSIPGLAVIVAAICIGLGMDYFDLRSNQINGNRSCILRVVMILEMMCILSAGTLGIKGNGRWVYSALQILVWVKWGVGCYLLGEYSPEHVQANAVAYDNRPWVDAGAMVYSSSFMLNAVSAFVRGWKLKS